MRALATTALLGLILLAPARAEPPTDTARTLDQPELAAAMNTVQFVHIKLWFAGKLGNWKLAAHELNQIASPLEQAASRSPTNKEDIATPLAALRNAIEAKDVASFIKSYTELTNGCNACHRSAGYGFINVQVPATSPFVDQDFADRVAEGRTLAHAICGICHVVPTQRAARLEFLGAELCRPGAPAVLHRSKPASASGIQPSARGPRPGDAESANERQPDRGAGCLF